MGVQGDGHEIVDTGLIKLIGEGAQPLIVTATAFACELFIASKPGDVVELGDTVYLGLRQRGADRTVGQQRLSFL